MTERFDKARIAGEIDFAAYFGSELGELRHLNGDEHQALCPFHEDTNPSLSVNLATGKWYCHGCKAKGDLFGFHMKRHGVSFQQALGDLAKLGGMDGNGGGAKEERPKGNERKRPKARAVPGTLKDRFVYHDENGEELFFVNRYEEIGADKTFRQGRCVEGKDIFNLDGVRLVPYRLPEVVKAEQIAVAEGEKTVEALRMAGFCASCNPMGAIKWKDEYSVHFKDKLVIILPDNDEPGRQHAEQVRKSLLPHVRSLKVVDLPGLPEKGDAADWLAAGGTAQQLMDLADQVPWESDPSRVRIVTARHLYERTFPDNPVIDGLLDEKESLLICSLSGVGKSLMTKNLGFVLALPPLSGLWNLFRVPRPRRTLYVQSENTAKATHVRLHKILEGHPEWTPALDSLCFPMVRGDIRLTGILDEPEFQERLIACIKEARAEVVVVDPLVSFSGARDENDNKGQRRSLDCLTRVQDETSCAVIVVHHMGEGFKEKANFIGRGGTAIGDWAANIIGLYPVDDQAGAPSSTILVRHAKSRNFELRKPFYLERTRNLVFVRTDPPEATRVCGERHVIEAISNLTNQTGELPSRQVLVKELRETTGCSRRTADNAVSFACNNGYIASEKSGKNTLFRVIEDEAA